MCPAGELWGEPMVPSFLPASWRMRRTTLFAGIFIKIRGIREIRGGFLRGQTATKDLGDRNQNRSRCGFAGGKIKIF